MSLSRNKLLTSILTVLVTLLVPHLLYSQTSGDKYINIKIDSLVNEDLPVGSIVGIQAYDLTADSMLCQYNANILSRPASTMKLLTAVAALSSGAIEQPFETKVYTNGRVENGVLMGDVYVVGGFDPEFDDSKMNSLISQLLSIGVRTIKGNIYGDISTKDSLYWGSGWMWDDNPSAFQPYMSPLMFNKGAIAVSVKPINGGKPKVSISPRSKYYKLINTSYTNNGKHESVKISRDWLNSTNNIIVEGNVRRPNYYKLNLIGSEKFFMNVFTERLQAKGVKLSKKYRFKRYVPTSSSVLLASTSTSSTKVLEEMMKESDNLNAEAVLYRIARHTTRKHTVTAKDGIFQVENMLNRLGFEKSTFNIADGCGLSHYNYVSPNIFVSTLRYAYSDKNTYDRLLAAMPISGVDGTLKNRMKDDSLTYRKVFAKTGSYTGVNSLAGYLINSEGHTIAFAIVCQSILKGKYARKLQDDICLLLCGGL